MPCKTDTRRSSATAPALLTTIAPALFYLRPSMGSYLLHPCSRAHGLGRSHLFSCVLFLSEFFICRASLEGFASHIHVLYREVPHILCIKKSGWDNLPWYPWPLCGRVATRQLLPCLSKSSTSLCFRRSFC